MNTKWSQFVAGNTRYQQGQYPLHLHWNEEPGKVAGSTFTPTFPPFSLQQLIFTEDLRISPELCFSEDRILAVVPRISCPNESYRQWMKQLDVLLFVCVTSCFFAFSTHPGCRSRTPSELVIDFLHFWDVLGCRVGNSKISRVGLSNLLQKLLQTLRTDGTLLLCLEKLQEKLGMKLDITVYQIVPKWLIADNCGDTGWQKTKKHSNTSHMDGTSTFHLPAFSSKGFSVYRYEIFIV